jgi:anti-anti-sigma factor
VVVDFATAEGTANAPSDCAANTGTPRSRGFSSPSTTIRESSGAFVLDLCDFASLDSHGLRLLLRGRASLDRDARTLAIVCPPGSVRRVMEIAGVDDLLFLYDSYAAMAAALIPAD